MTRWLVDGMNVIGTRPDGWWNDRDRAIRSFVGELAEFVEATGDEVEVVFDRSPRPWTNPAQGTVAVDFARSGGRNAADYVIERKVGEDPEPAQRVVVTSDRRLVDRVRGLGGKTMSSRSFLNRMESAASKP